MESSNQEENGYVSEEDVAKDEFERTELFKNMRRHVSCERAQRPANEPRERRRR